MNGDSTLRAFLLGPAAEVAPRLLGAELTSDLGPRVSLRITEVEAYAGVGQDPGSHAHRRRTQRNAAMFGPPGHAYVYFTYGMHWCLNVVAHPEGEAGAVLIRAGEVVVGVAAARSTTTGSPNRQGPGPRARPACAMRWVSTALRTGWTCSTPSAVCGWSCRSEVPRGAPSGPVLEPALQAPVRRPRGGSGWTVSQA